MDVLSGWDNTERKQGTEKQGRCRGKTEGQDVKQNGKV